MSTIVVTIVLSLMGLSSCGEAEETTSRSTATSEEELAAQLGTDTEPVDAGHNRNIDVGTLSARAGAPTDGKILARWEPSPEMAKTLRLPFFEKATLTYRAGKMILVSQYGDGGRLERVLVERPAEKAAERKFDLQTQERPEYFTLSETGVVRYFSWEGREFNTGSVTFIDPNAMNIGNNVQQRPCIPTKLSSAAMELVRLYDQLHAFKDDPEFIRVGFAGGPYSAWLQAIKRHRDTNSGLELLDELGFIPGTVMMLGMNYLGEDLSESDLLFIEDSERKIQAGLALTRCTELGSVQETIQAASEARQLYAAEVKRQESDELARREAWDDEVTRGAEVFDAHIAEFQAAVKPFDQLSVENYLSEEVRGQFLRLKRAIGAGEAAAQDLLALLEAPPAVPSTEQQAGIDHLRQILELNMANFAGAREVIREFESDEVPRDVAFQGARASQQQPTTAYPCPLAKSTGEQCFPNQTCPTPWTEYRSSAGETAWGCDARNRPGLVFLCNVEGSGGDEGCMCSSRELDPRWRRRKHT